MVENGKRLTIGLLVSGIVDEFTMLVCKGVVHAAKEADVNLVVFPGKYLDRDLTERREIMYEYQYNTIFSYAKKENIDALIVSPACGSGADPRRPSMALPFLGCASGSHPRPDEPLLFSK